MKETNKSVKKRIFKIILQMIAFNIFLETIAIFTLYLITGYIFPDDKNLMENYEDKKAKCELMESVRDNVIKENDRIYLENIQNSDIVYKIYNCSTNNNIIFNYYIPHYENQYNVTITLSKEYKILDEKTITKLEDYETYKKSILKTHKFILIFMLGIGLIVSIVYLIMSLYNIKKENCN